MFYFLGYHHREVFGYTVMSCHQGTIMLNKRARVMKEFKIIVRRILVVIIKITIQIEEGVIVLLKEIIND
ncbi:hypothetical protein DZC72_08655 [Maribacter algicola]|uniref:Uncharacterized protein n=1 Tax=Maribacter algicola TaxID=2498892 RepID=A0A3R8RQU4_9FLAO|nr:hypothetical protein DZC72_08655 [Maribacter algicola]